MATIWTGALAFGLVSVPVGLVTAQDRRGGLPMRRVSRGSGAPVRHRRWDPLEDRELAHEETVSGLEVAPGRFATIDRATLAALRAGQPPGDAGPSASGVPEPVPPAPVPVPGPRVTGPPAPAPMDPGGSEEAEERVLARRPPEPRTIAVEGFVELDEIPPELYDRTYWLAPLPAGRPAYRLLHAALSDAGRGGVARVVLRERERLALVRPGEGLLTLHTLHWPEDVREDDRRRIIAGLAETAVADSELDLARRLIAYLEREFRPEEHRDSARARIAAYLRERAPAAEPPRAERASPHTDLLAALRASLAEAEDAS